MSRIPDEILKMTMACGIDRHDAHFCLDVANHASQEAMALIVRHWEMAALVKPDVALVFAAMTMKMMEATASKAMDDMIAKVKPPEPGDKEAALAQWKADMARYGVTWK